MHESQFKNLYLSARVQNLFFLFGLTFFSYWLSIMNRRSEQQVCGASVIPAKVQHFNFVAHSFISSSILQYLNSTRARKPFLVNIY